MTASLKNYLENSNGYHAAKWSEPVVMEMTGTGRRGVVFEDAPAPKLPGKAARKNAPVLPEVTEHDALRHYLHLSQMTLGMMGVSLFGTCTMKYNPRIGERATSEHLKKLHPLQEAETLQGVLELYDNFSDFLCEVSGMDQFIFQAGGGADAAYTHACLTRAYHASRGELQQRDQIITTIQTHPCSPATANTAGFEVITLSLEENGYPSIEQLKSVVGPRTAALMVNNPDDMGIYNPDIKEWVKIVHEAGGLCFYDHANFNGVMSRLRARELGFDACMFMLHKTFGAPKGGGGPAVGAYGCAEHLVPFLPAPVVKKDGDSYVLDEDRPQSIGRVREFWGNAPQVMKAYAWARAMGAEGLREAADISVLANNYMDWRLGKTKGVSRSNPGIDAPRMEMTRHSVDQVTQDTGCTVFEISNRMTDFGIDALWLSHEPWLVPEPFTPEAGELWSKEDIDYWIDVLEHVIAEAYEDADLVKTAPHNGPIKALTSALDEPSVWATTWRAYERKHPSKIAAE
ncbi:aminomethyl-transferring glycine dehydrogenase subunit GcvPB [Histidinibacterium aquaticum]|uniref:Aminotransferase class V-fold PLP-dependent enzyme n=1 Tax=Histidinibacterium aquaticum TaxID=2613962 RepID=A0A5J5GKY6_9RHOB|nr:aminomethyl-transferring glycine dehydrogenase subunit GcvPB [Histidinibacterium aquaticum]KAA9008800.1 aminotransferase class V-fold PLP-dependent enzyme [Histidinibacterium aquaticum]